MYQEHRCIAFTIDREKMTSHDEMTSFHYVHGGIKVDAGLLGVFLGASRLFLVIAFLAYSLARWILFQLIKLECWDEGKIVKKKKVSWKKNGVKKSICWISFRDKTRGISWSAAGRNWILLLQMDGWCQKMQHIKAATTVS